MDAFDPQRLARRTPPISAQPTMLVPLFVRLMSSALDCVAPVGLRLRTPTSALVTRHDVACVIALLPVELPTTRVMWALLARVAVTPVGKISIQE